jgi:hypothetical protein
VGRPHPSPHRVRHHESGEADRPGCPDRGACGDAGGRQGRRGDEVHPDPEVSCFALSERQDVEGTGNGTEHHRADGSAPSGIPRRRERTPATSPMPMGTAPVARLNTATAVTASAGNAGTPQLRRRGVETAGAVSGRPVTLSGEVGMEVGRQLADHLRDP